MDTENKWEKGYPIDTAFDGFDENGEIHTGIWFSHMHVMGHGCQWPIFESMSQKRLSLTILAHRKAQGASLEAMKLAKKNQRIQELKKEIEVLEEQNK